eukprot:539735-Rhodomonas_salina.2
MPSSQYPSDIPLLPALVLWSTGREPQGHQPHLHRGSLEREGRSSPGNPFVLDFFETDSTVAPLSSSFFRSFHIMIRCPSGSAS